MLFLRDVAIIATVIVSLLVIAVVVIVAFLHFATKDFPTNGSY